MRAAWKDDEQSPPVDLRLAVPALSLWAGLLVVFWARSASWWVISVLGASGVLAIVVLIRRRYSPRWRAAGYGAVTSLACAACAILVGWCTLSAAEHDPLIQAGESGSWVTVRLAADHDAAPAPSRFGHGGNRWRISGTARAVSIGPVSRRSGVSVTVFAEGDAWAQVEAGDKIEVHGVAGGYDFASVPAATIRARGAPTVVAAPPVWSRWADAVRRSLRHSAAAIPSDPGGLLRGLVVGDKGGIDGALSADAKTSGLTHLVAVSGTHMAIVSGMVLLLLRRAGPRIAATGVAVSLAAMVILVGPAPSVLRSALMGMIGVAGTLTGRERTALSALAAAVFVLLCADPALAVSVGFALSVQATAALILVAPVWVRALTGRGVPRGWAQLVVMPVAAHLATMPVIAAISGRISVVAIPANIAVAPVVAPAMLIGLACAVVGPWWSAGGVAIAHIDSPLLGWVASVAHRMARWPGATVPWPASPAGVIGLAALVIVGGLVLRHRGMRAAAMAALLGAGLVLIPAQHWHPGWPARGWLITGCEVGQGDAMVLSTNVPGEVVMVDTGPEPAAADACLDRLGVTRIALLVITHLHEDHVGGLTGAVAGRRVDAIGVGPDRSSRSAWHAIGQAAASHGVVPLELTPGMQWARDGLSLRILGPRQVFHGTNSDPNNDSVVMLATHRGVRMLMTGDIEPPAQQSLLDSGVDLGADILKQPHHGSSALLPAFVEAVHPSVAVIGVGQHNDYGHPSSRALRMDRHAGVTTVLRTDQQGDVEVVTRDGHLATVARGPTLVAR